MLKYSLAHKGNLAGYPDAPMIGGPELLTVDCDVLIPAALGGVITCQNAEGIRAKVIIEAANAPISPDADDILERRGVIILPDILANAGGVTASYFEWVQNRQHYRWDLNRVRQELEHVLTRSFEAVWEVATERKVSLRTAAYIVGIGRVGRATVLGGIA